MIRGGSIICAAALAACSSNGTDSGNGGGIAPAFDRTAMLTSIADRAIMPAYTAFAAEAEALRTAVQAFDEAIGEADEADKKAAAQSAWRSAMGAWQEAELTLVGPAGPNSRRGGQGLRQRLYSWPADNPCRVQQELVRQRFAELDAQTDNAYGLDALEYLLFEESTEAVCPPQVDIIADGSWNALIASGDLPEVRGRYASAAAELIRQDAVGLLAAWENGFRDQFAGAGQSGSVYPTAQAAIDDLFAALYYIELQTKDEKLGAVAGLNSRCLNDSCPEVAELPIADASRESIRRNVRGFAAVLFGGDPDDPRAVGFDDFLAAAGAAALAEDLRQRVEAAEAAVQDVEPSMLQAIVSDKEELSAQFGALTELTDILKSQFVSVLALEIPREGAADND